MCSFFLILQVSLGVIPKNENKREEMTEVVEALHQYVPGCDDRLLKVLIDLSFLFPRPLT